MDPTLASQMRPNIGAPLPGVQVPPQMPQMPMMMGMRPSPAMINQFTVLPDQEEKRREFAKSVYVSGFEKTVTVAMLEKHFSAIKNVHGIKVPTTKFNENKGFAFIYFGSEDDATFVKKALDRSVILNDKIRVTKTVVADKLSKMIFRLKTKGLTDKEIENNEKVFFNDENLEKHVETIIEPIFNNLVEVNKIVIPITKNDKKPLKYARVFYYISNLKEAAGTVRRLTGANEAFDQQKEDYNTVLSYIADLLNKNETFTKYATAEIYEYTNKNQSNVLHLKGISYKQG